FQLAALLLQEQPGWIAFVAVLVHGVTTDSWVREPTLLLQPLKPGDCPVEDSWQLPRCQPPAWLIHAVDPLAGLDFDPERHQQHPTPEAARSVCDPRSVVRRQYQPCRWSRLDWSDSFAVEHHPVTSREGLERSFGCFVDLTDLTGNVGQLPQRLGQRKPLREGLK